MCPAFLQFWSNVIHCKSAFKNGFHCYLCSFERCIMKHLKNAKLYSAEFLRTEMLSDPSNFHREYLPHGSIGPGSHTSQQPPTRVENS